MYEEKKMSEEMPCEVTEMKQNSICDKAKRIRALSVKAGDIARAIRRTMFFDTAPTKQNEKEAACLDDELNGILDEMQLLMETLIAINSLLAGHA